MYSYTPCPEYTDIPDHIWRQVDLMLAVSKFDVYDQVRMREAVARRLYNAERGS